MHVGALLLLLLLLRSGRVHLFGLLAIVNEAAARPCPFARMHALLLWCTPLRGLTS